MKNLISKLNDKIKLGEENSPFLFLWKNLELTNSIIENFSKDFLKENKVSNIYFHILRDNWETIKIKEAKDFIKQAEMSVPYLFQIFFIENIWRLTLAASNSLLKFFEEPWRQNIIFLSNSSENNILDTILSRVQIVELFSSNKIKESDFFVWMIDSYISFKNDDLISYLYRNKLEKIEYLEFLENLLIYSKNNIKFVDFLEEINEDVNWIKQNNLNPRYITDKWLLKIR